MLIGCRVWNQWVRRALPLSTDPLLVRLPISCCQRPHSAAGGLDRQHQAGLCTLVAAAAVLDGQ
jgi:hypothetical protein